MNNKPLEIQSLTFSTENGLKVDCRFDECGGRIVEMFPDAKSLDKVATVEQILADVDPYDTLAKPEVSIWGRARQDAAWLDTVLLACAAAKTVVEVLGRDTGKAVDQGSTWIHTLAETLGGARE